MASADPLRGSNDAIWTAHAVARAGGGASEERWYEINPLTNPPTLLQSGKATDASLYVWNGAVSPDRVVNPSGKAFGSNMSMGFSTSSASACPAIQDVSKVGNNAQSAFLLVKQSAGPDADRSCNPGPVCRWGDYSGASPDPAANLGGTEGNVWHSNQWNVPNIDNMTPVWRTENWEIIP